MYIFYAFAKVFEIFNEYALMAGINAAIIPTASVTTNNQPSLSQINSYGLKLNLKSASDDFEIITNAILPKIVPKIKPTKHKSKLSIKTNAKSCLLLAPFTRNKANSVFLSFKVLNKAMKIEIPEINIIP